MDYRRILQSQIVQNIGKGKVIVLYGARRVGKTTLCKHILDTSTLRCKYINCEEITNKLALQTADSSSLKRFFGDAQLVVLDEAQAIPQIGAILKLFHDTFPQIQILATGSSSFDLANSVGEPLTGRARRFTMFPLSFEELQQQYNEFELRQKLEQILIYGTYPSVFDRSEDDSKEELREIVTNYLYKDILQFEGLRRRDLISNLLRALALQLGNEVSYRELAQLLGEDHKTIARYIELLEQCFIIFRLRPFSRNLRKEIAHKNKIYFYDLGIRNNLIQNYNSLPLRSDTGALWENFCVLERLKYNENNRRFVNSYFRRTYTQKEIDYIEEYNGVLHAYEFKWNKNTIKKDEEFLSTYEHSTISLINQHSIIPFIT